MKQLRWAALALVCLLPLAAACDMGTASNAVPTSVSNAAAMTATAVAPTVNSAVDSAAMTATALAPTVNSLGSAAAQTATALAPAVNDAGAAAATAAAGAATAATTAVSGSLSAEDSAYLQQVSGLATQMQNSPELSDAVQALTTAATQGATGGTVDTTALNDKIQKASTFMNGIATQAQALQPPADMQPVQTELMKPITDWQGALTSAQTAVGAANWADATKAAGQMAQATTELGTLIADLAARGVK